MNDFQVMAQVFDGGTGPHPLLDAAFDAWYRQVAMEMNSRNDEILKSPRTINSHRRCAEGIVWERIRLARTA